MRTPSASTKPSRNPAAISDVADVRQRLLAEQFIASVTWLGCSEPGVWNDRSTTPTPICSRHCFNCATISFGPPQKLIGSTRLTLAGRRPSPATLVEFQQRGGDPVVQRVRL